MTPATREACRELVAKWLRAGHHNDRFADTVHDLPITRLSALARAAVYFEAARELDAVLAREPVSVADELPAEIGRPAWSEVVDG
jgi:hypothetical protein